jgi:hypothetical protein
LWLASKIKGKTISISPLLNRLHWRTTKHSKHPPPSFSDRIKMVIRRRSSLDSQTGFYPFFGVYQPFDPRGEFVTARFLSPLVFGLLRLLIAVYGVAVIVIDIVLTGALSSTIVLIGKRGMETSIVISRISPISHTSP